jgi:hypothetical protein
VNKQKKTRAQDFGQDAPTNAPPYERATFKDDSGISRVVLVPPGETDVRAGIPVSLDLSPLFGHMPAAFQRAFYQALHDQGLVEPTDFFKPGAAERYRRALFTVIKHDFLDVQTLANQEITNHG